MDSAFGLQCKLPPPTLADHSLIKLCILNFGAKIPPADAIGKRTALKLAKLEHLINRYILYFYRYTRCSKEKFEFFPDVGTVYWQLIRAFSLPLSDKYS